MTRKIIQLVFQTVTGKYDGKLFALCDDGTVWKFQENGWIKLPEISQQ